MITLPREKVKAKSLSPKRLVIFSKPKVGKTSLLSSLDDCLILDFEGGTENYDSMAVQIKSVEDLKNIGEAIHAEIERTGASPYKYVAVDTATALEELAISYAEELYSATAQGKNWYTKGKPEYGDILGMPNGAGYRWVRIAFDKLLDYISTFAPRTILAAHVKDVFLEKAGVEFTALELDLIGKIKRTVASYSDAIGYVVRKKDGNYISFKTSDDVVCGARPDHLKNKEILISKVNDSNQLMTFWDEIYID